jgi:ferritin-like metal-binding protein YciE
MLAFEVLPELCSSVKSETLADKLRAHLEQTRGHVERVERVFRLTGAEPSSGLSPAFEGLTRQHDELAGKIVEERLRDLFHAVAAAHTEHYELAAYTALLELAQGLDHGEAAQLLAENRDEERDALEHVESEARRLREELTA